MRFSLRQIDIFVTVADRGTTSAAGTAIALSQSAVSGAIAELEGSLGCRLFDRVGKRLVLNDVGRALLPEARLLLDHARQLEARFGAVAMGAGAGPPVRLRLGASTTIGNYLLPELIAAFCADAPGSRVDVTIGNTRDIAAAAMRLDVDLGFVEGPVRERDLEVLPWIDDELVVVAAALHPLAIAGRRVALAQLRKAQWLQREPGSGTREAVEQALLPLQALNGGMAFGSTEAIKQATAAGLGLTCLSRYAVRDLIALGRLVELDTTLPRLKRPFHLIRHRQKHTSPTIDRFVAHCFA